MEKNIPIGQLLLSNNYITMDQLNDALAKQKMQPGKRLGDVLVNLGYVKEKDVLKLLSKKLNVPYIENPIFSVETDAINLIPEDLLMKSRVLPLYVREGVLFVATADPLDFYSIEDIRVATGMHVECVISSKKEIEVAQDKIFTRLKASDAINVLHQENTIQADEGENAEMLERIDAAPVVKLLNNIVSDAIQSNASDIHIEPEEGKVLVRFRIDGDLRVNMELQNNIHPLLTTRIKIMAGMNIAEKRVPLDGRFKFQHGITEIDMRVSSLPTIYGEKIVMRLLGTNQDVSYNFEDMGFSERSINTIRSMLRYSNGIILATGPTGSGKTTTLYSMLKEIINPKLNIVTVEDPVEKRIDGVNQVQVNTKAGLTFASGLRSILRQDPDIIMIGEIRDAETAEIAVRASITGHLVISTLHTNDSFSSIARLVDMGVEPYLLADSLRGVIAQRLVKRVCPHCKKEMRISDNAREFLGDPTLEKVYIGEGCPLCGNTGYRGRIAVNEIFRVTPEIKRIIVDNGTDVKAMREYAKKKDIITMREEVVALVKEGTTSVEEALKILYSIE
ncbi:GspE/PulE family protein [Anaerorhabdus sp.]|nr:ATPase, T2SS/T4P/T4SS family [Anaerorhabdus sp.]MEA4875484.1 ATPase, T2SS/T4P/T4SS family [Anaerorhabdus sp.]